MLNIHGLKLPMIGDEIVAGDVKFVDSGGTKTLDDPGYGKTPEKTFATLDYSFAKMTANNGDYIIVLPGHAENIVLTTTVDVDVAGLNIIGLGHGTDRPTFTQTVVAMYLDIAAANTRLKNLLFMAGVNTGTGAMVNVIGDDAIIEMCEFKNVSATLHTNHMIEASGANTADGLIVKGCRFDTMAAGDGDTDSAISLAEVQDRVQIIDNILVGSYDDACIHNVTGKTCTNLLIARNTCYQTQAGDHAIEIVSACTGHCMDNILYASSFAAMLDPGSLICSGNKGSIGVDTPMVTVPGIGLMGEPRLAMHTTAAMGGGTFDAADHPTAFTVTGTVLARCWGVVTTSVTSTSNTGTLDLGCVDDLDLYISTTTVNATALVAGDSWGCATAASIGVDLDNAGQYSVQTGGVIQFDVNTNNMTAGVMNIYCQWVPISADGNVVAA